MNKPCNIPMRNVIVSYYVSHDDALNETNRKSCAFPAPDDLKIGRDGICDQSEIGKNLLLDYNVEDPTVINNILIMYVDFTV